jgi:RNA-directed DNA polymerase
VAVADNTEKYVRHKTLYDPTRPDRPNKKPRPVISINGDWRRIQTRLYKRIFAQRIKASPISFGGVAGRDTKQGALAHSNNSFLYVADISNFFPSVSNDRVFRLFRQQLNCSPTVARLLTKLCTYDYHLAIGLVTSPILSDQVLLPIDRRLIGLCEKSLEPALTATRFIDDIAISSFFNLKKSYVERIVRQILSTSGFKLKDEKEDCGRIDEGMPITQIRVRNGRADVTKEYIAHLEKMIDDHRNLSNGLPFCGPLLTSSTLEGKVRHACRINPGRKRTLLPKFRSIRWDNLWWNARALGLVAAEKTLVLRGADPPDFSRAYSDGVQLPQFMLDTTGSDCDDAPPF